MSVPVIRALVSQYPDLRITVVTRGFFSPFFRGIKNVAIFEVDLKTKYKGVFGLYKLYKELNVLRFDAVADIHIENKVRYYSKTSHIRMGMYRQSSPLWRASATNLQDRSNDKYSYKERLIPLEINRICYSHEYIGENRKSYDPKYNREDDKQINLF